MSWFSILPESFAVVEKWVVRFFLVLGCITIGPWVLLISYDAILYVFRTATYEIPHIGGRARNRPRPRAPSLSERPSGKRRTFSLSITGAPMPENGGGMNTDLELKRREKTLGHERNGRLS